MLLTSLKVIPCNRSGTDPRSKRVSQVFTEVLSQAKNLLSHCNDFVIKVYQKRFLCYHLSCSFQIFINVFAFLYVKANSKESCEEISSPSTFRKMLMSAFLLRFKVNYFERMRGYPLFSLWIPIAIAKIYFFRKVLTWRKNLCIY